MPVETRKGPAHTHPQTVQSCWGGSFPSFCAEGLALVSPASLTFVSDSNPPSGSPEPVSSPMSCLTCLQSSPSRLSLWTVLILSTSWVAVCPEAHDKHRFPSLLGVCTSGKSCRGFVPLHAVVYPLRKREMRPGRTQDSCRCLGPELLWTWALCS